MIRFKNVSRVYKTGTEALHRINLKINDGEFVFIIGRSGAGKSTMVSLLMCEDIPTEGDVIINGINTRNLTPKKIPKFRRSLGIVFQDFRLISNLNVFDNVAFAMRVVGKSRKQINKKVKSVLSLVGLSHKIYDLPCNLSGGEQQRVALARAIVNNPKIIIADEPTGNVDPEMSQDIIKLLAAINKRGITVIVVTHDHELLTEFSSRVVELEEGEIISDSANDFRASEYISEEDLFIDDIGDDEDEPETGPEEITLPEPEAAPEVAEETEISVPEEKAETSPEKEDDLLDGFYDMMNAAFDEPEEEKEADENEF